MINLTCEIRNTSGILLNYLNFNIAMYYKSMLKVIGSDGIEVKMTHEAYSICIKRWSAMPINNVLLFHSPLFRP